MPAIPSTAPADPPSNLGSWLRSLILLLQEHGHSRESLLNIIGMDEATLAKPLNRVPVSVSDILWEMAYKAEVELVAIKVASHTRLADFQSIGAAISSAANIEQAMQQMQRYPALVADILPLSIEESDDALTLNFEYDSALPLSPFRLEAAALVAVRMVSELLPSPLRLERVLLSRPKPKDDTPWQRAFNAPVHWDHPTIAVVISKAEAQRELLTSNAEVTSSYQMVMDGYLHQHQKNNPLAEIQRVIAAQLQNEELSLDQVAARLNLSRRQLQRTLQEAGTNFRDLHKSCRMRLAEQLLQAGKSVKEVAYSIGYTDVSVFHRAFKKWRGETPSEFQKQHGPGTKGQ